MASLSSTRSAVLRILIGSCALSCTVSCRAAAPRTSTWGWSIAARPFDADFAGSASQVIWSSDGQFVAAQGAEGIAIRDGKTLKLRHFLSRAMLNWTSSPQSSPQTSGYNETPLLLSFVGNRLAFSYSIYNANSDSYAPFIEWRDVRNGKILMLWKNVNVSSDKQSLYFIGRKHSFRVYHFASQRWFNVTLPLRIDEAAPNITNPNDKDATSQPSELYFSPDGHRAADQIGDGRLRLWNVKSRRVLTILADKRGEYRWRAGATGPVAWSGDGRFIATLGEDPTHKNIFYEEGPNDGSINEHSPVVKLWDAHSGKLLQWWRSAASYNDETISALRWLDARRLAVCANNRFEVWDAPTKRRLSATATRDNWELETAQALSPDGKRLAAVAAYRNPHIPADTLSRLTLLRVLDQGVMVPQFAVTAGAEALDKIAWNNDGRFVATTTTNGGVRVWSFTRRLEKLAASFDDSGANHLGWTRSGKFWTSNFYRISLWDARHNWFHSEIKPIHGEKQNPPANGLFITPNERTHLQIADGFDTPRDAVWRSDDAKKPYMWLQAPDSGGFVESVSPDGRFYCVSSTKNDQPFLTLYDLTARNRKLELLPSPRNPKSGDAVSESWESSAVFSRDGRVLSFGGRIFSMPSGKVIGERRHPLDGNALALSSHGKWIVRLARSETNHGLWLFEAQNGRRVRLLSRDTGGISAGIVADFSPDDKTIAIARFGDLEFYDRRSGALRSEAVVLQPSRPDPKSTQRLWRVWATQSSTQ